MGRVLGNDPSCNPLTKKHKRRLGAGLQKHSEPPQQNSDVEGEQGTNGFSASEDVEPDTSAS
ncbi:hypothetical protein CK203_062459 [Vitis vinifera]|uniref:Uncharacterized protein n=1 Tax=Vitis vinifera TaxID=29760 RepID=A0A438FUE2_VITVI|nr:hypothetical protein CK203_062459 [Vitis vinifera]